MNPTVRLCLVLHNHQPVGNFDHVMEAAYADSYAPFLEVFESFPTLKLSLHLSGSLCEFLEQRHPEYLDRVAALVQVGQIELIGGPFYEPILTMLPSRDRRGQIQDFSRYLQQRLGGQIRGMWMPERVWEQSLVSDLAMSGIEYTVLDDFHFRSAGWRDEALTSYFLTEDQGQLLKIFPGSESLRYMLPFRPVEETIEFLRELGQRQPGAVAVFGDDGEKFGTWPDTKQHVYEQGWLRDFFQALTEQQDWLETNTLAEAADGVPPGGTIYLPDASYREMTEWALPTAAQQEFLELRQTWQQDPRWSQLQPFLRGGYWRNFKVKYPETNEMYARMMYVSQRLAQLEEAGHAGPELEEARQHLYRGQCNCPYWHGAFGGVYLPHLRNAIYRELIQADHLLDQFLQYDNAAVEAQAADFNFDTHLELRLANQHLIAWLAPHQGGHLYELDVRGILHNALATMDRRWEGYHQQVQAAEEAAAAGHPHDGGGQATSIHDQVRMKQADLGQRLLFDSGRRKSLVDHFWDPEMYLDAVADGRAIERGDFASQPFEAQVRKGEQRLQVLMSRQGNVNGWPMTVRKSLALVADSPTLEISYLLENLPPEEDLHFAIELNFSGMPSEAEDRFFHDLAGQRCGDLGRRLDLPRAEGLGLSDQWLGLEVQLKIDRPAGIWAFPIQTVSQSEGGFEAVHQSVVVMPHWMVTGDDHGRWSVKLRLTYDTRWASQRAVCLALREDDAV